MTIVKICGLRTVEHALVAADAGADMLGMIFAPSRRQIAPTQAAAIVAAVREQFGEQRPRMVGVFVNETPAQMLAFVKQCGLDIVQLSGDEPYDSLRALDGIPVIKALRLQDTPDERDWLAGALPGRLRIMLDAHVPGAYGGAGVVGDWVRAAELAQRYPILLAGGLHPVNVAEAIHQVAPWGVDVSSGVEIDGVKDSASIIRFVRAAHAAAPVS